MDKSPVKLLDKVRQCIRLRVKNIDFAMNQIVVRDGKGKKDRITVLPEVVKPSLKEHLVYCQKIQDSE